MGSAVDRVDGVSRRLAVVVAAASRLNADRQAAARASSGVVGHAIGLPVPLQSRTIELVGRPGPITPVGQLESGYPSGVMR